MTKEEAIEWLESRKEHWEMSDEGQKLSEALGIAIQAIEKLSKIEQIMNATEYIENGAIYSYCYNQERKVDEIREVLKNE